VTDLTKVRMVAKRSAATEVCLSCAGGGFNVHNLIVMSWFSAWPHTASKMELDYYLSMASGPRLTKQSSADWFRRDISTKEKRTSVGYLRPSIEP
jgi:hypothetical protein